jgi:ubiquinone/menaquinone biosynthesis C-methylase UbiE
MDLRHRPTGASTDTYKLELSKSFSRTSATHDAAAPLFAHFGSLLVSSLPLKRGDRVLDVACGTGATLLPTAEVVGREGHVVGVDLAQGMIDRLRATIAELGLANAEAHVGDGENLLFDDASFDGLICAFGLFFFADPSAALAEFGRVLRPGGVLGITTFARQGSDSMDAVWRLIGAHAPVPRPAKRELRFDTPDTLFHALKAAGFVEIDVQHASYDLAFEELDDWLAWLRSMEFGDYVEMMNAEATARLLASASAAFAAHGNGPAVVMPMDGLITRALRP